jgi:outer membrane cobalamin receptor
MTARLLSAFLLASFVGLLAPSGHAQVSSSSPETLSGTVLDPVRLLNPAGVEAVRTFSDGRGRFHFKSLTEGNYVLRASLLGFATATKSVRPGTSVKIVLALAPVREQVVVTATRTDAPSGQLGATTSMLTEKEIENRLTLSLSDALRPVAGATAVRSGGLGANTSLFVRGGERDHNKVFLDGMVLNEPGGALDFSNLTTENIERVEVVRGPQSALFGSDAMASVIQLFTARGRAETARPRLFFSGEGGNNDTWRARTGLSGAAGIFDYSLLWARLSTDNHVPNNVFHNTTWSGNVGAALSERTSLRLILRGELGRAGTPGQTTFGRPDQGASLRRRDADIGLRLRNQTTSFLDQQLLYSFAQSRQVSRDLVADELFVPTFEDRVAECVDFSTGEFGPCLFFDTTGDFLNHSRRHHLSYQHNWRAGSVGRRTGQHVFTSAFEWDRELGFLGDRLSPGSEVNAERDNFGWVFQWQALWERLFLTLGGRIEDNDSFGTSAVPRVSLAHLLRQGGSSLGATKLKFNFGLGIKEPNLLESFSPGPFVFGNPELAPERARSFDFGVEQRFWTDRGKLEVNWFDNRFRDLIGFEIVDFVTLSGSFFNIGRSKAKGAEAILELAPLPGLRGRGSYTFLDSQVTESGTVFDPVFEEGNRLLRRPKNSGALELFWNWRRLTVASTTFFVGRRTDSDFVLLGLTSIEGYTRWDLAWNYRSSYRVTYFGVIENLLNEDYMEVLGFPALKLTFRVGARVEF